MALFLRSLYPLGGVIGVDALERLGGHGALAAKDAPTVDDLVGPLFCSDQSWEHDIPRWAGPRMPELRTRGVFES